MFVNLRISTFEHYLPTWFIWDHNNQLVIIMVVMTDLLQFKSICNSWKCLLLTWIWSLFLILLNSCKYKGQWLSEKSVRNKGKQKQRQHVSHLDDLFLDKKKSTNIGRGRPPSSIIVSLFDHKSLYERSLQRSAISSKSIHKDKRVVSFMHKQNIIAAEHSLMTLHNLWTDHYL